VRPTIYRPAAYDRRDRPFLKIDLPRLSGWTDCWRLPITVNAGPVLAGCGALFGYQSTSTAIVEEAVRPRHVYRDWGIRAFNERLPSRPNPAATNAGDQVAHDGDRSHSRNGYLTWAGASSESFTISLMIVSMSLMRGTQALTVAAARCHDHKFDPIRSKTIMRLWRVQRLHGTNRSTVETTSEE